MFWQNTKGFTLFETIITIALSAGILTTSAMLFHSTLTAEARVRGQQRLADSVFLIEQTIQSILISGSNVTEPASGTSNTLAVATEDSSTDPTQFSLSNDALMITEGSNASQSLTPETVTITDFSVTRLDGTPASVSISVTLETAAGLNTTLSKTASWTTTLRYDE